MNSSLIFIIYVIKQTTNLSLLTVSCRLIKIVSGWRSSLYNILTWKVLVSFWFWSSALTAFALCWGLFDHQPFALPVLSVCSVRSVRSAFESSLFFSEPSYFGLSSRIWDKFPWVQWFVTLHECVRTHLLAMSQLFWKWLTLLNTVSVCAAQWLQILRKPSAPHVTRNPIGRIHLKYDLYETYTFEHIFGLQW